MRWRPLLLLAGLLLGAGGHEISVAAIHISAGEDGVAMQVDVSLTRLARAGVLPADAEAFAALDATALSAAAPRVADYLRTRLRVEIDGAAAGLAIAAPRPGYERSPIDGSEYMDRALVDVRVAAPRTPQQVQVIGDFPEWPGSVVWIAARWPPGSTQPWAISTHEPRFTWTAGELQSWWRFVWLGIHHILIGFDHLAFLLGLLLVARRLRALVGVVTAFTVAHSVTLTLAATGVLATGEAVSRLVEVAIAVSIICVAIENLVAVAARRSAPRLPGSSATPGPAERPAGAAAEGPRWRWASTAIFGLVHGFGFASVLAGHLPAGGVVAPLVGFNLGVEIGQLAVVALVWPLLWLLRRSPAAGRGERRHRLVVIIGSCAIAILGGLWLCDRMFGTGIMAWTG